MPDIQIRAATENDSSLILKFVKELARYEKAEHEVVATVESIKNSIFCENANSHAIICSLDEKPIGFAIYFFNYSTWLGKKGLYLEDLFVSPEHRQQGIGKALFKYIANIAITQDCGRFEWSVLTWNQPAIEFYKSFGAEPQSEWVTYRLSGTALQKSANGITND
ncbi:MAG: N-acetyltransferase family protein [Gammaproteobacteria bacterium]|jgi:GNAT superfamily N-acetyltransferase